MSHGYQQTPHRMIRTAGFIVVIVLLAMTAACKKGRSSHGCGAAPSGLAMTQAVAEYYVDVPITPNPITFNAACPPESFTIDPALPDGLMLSSAGILDGTPQAESPLTTYTITATNADGLSADLQFTLAVGETPVAGLSYSISDVNIAVGQDLSPLAPTLAQGVADDYSVSPALPSGLELDPNTGVLSGNPDTPTPGTLYTITAMNTTGSATTTIFITVWAAPSQSEPARFVDVNDNGRIDEGDQLILHFDQPIAVNAATRDDFTLPVTGDSFGPDPIITAGPEAEELTIALGPGAGDGKFDPTRLRSRGTFDPAQTDFNSPSGIGITIGTPTITSAITGSTVEDGVAADIVPSSVFAASFGEAAFLVTGDIDRDGDDDIIACGVTQQVWFGDGAGGFSAGSEIVGLTDDARDGLLTDFDRDGDLDLLLASYEHTLTLFTNDGAGSFTEAGDLDSTVGGQSIAAADVDGDDRVDVAIGYAFENFVSIVFGNGSPTAQMATAEPALALAFVDATGDGHADLCVGHATLAGNLYENDGAGNFAPLAELPLSGIVAFATTDFDRDGDDDIVATGEGTAALLRNDGDVFTVAVNFAGGSDVAVSDFDSDAVPDLLIAGSDATEIWYGLGDGTFDGLAESYPPSQALALIDRDHDGDADWICAASGQPIAVYSNSLTGTWGSATYVAGLDLDDGGDSTFDSALGDLDGDGNLDLVCARVNLSAGIAWNLIYMGRADGTYDDAIPFDSNNSECVVLADVDRDGDLDIVFGNRSNYTEVFLNELGTFVTPPFTFGTGNTACIAAQDLNGDGIIDLAVGKRAPNEIWLGNGDGTFADTGQALGGGYTRCIGTADVDGDGDIDLLDATSLARTNRIYLNDGFGVFTVSDNQFGNADVQRLALGDIDRDGNIDLLLAQTGSGPVGFANAVWFGNGDGAFTLSEQVFTPADVSVACALLDFDGDGDLDAVFANNGEDYLYINDGSGQFLQSMTIGSVGSSYDVDPIDIDGDGDLDLIISGADGASTHVLMNR